MIRAAAGITAAFASNIGSGGSRVHDDGFSNRGMRIAVKKVLMHDASGPQVSSHNLKTGVYDSYETDESGFLIHTAADFERTDHFNEAVGLYELLFVAEKDDDDVVWPVSIRAAERTETYR